MGCSDVDGFGCRGGVGAGWWVGARRWVFGVGVGEGAVGVVDDDVAEFGLFDDQGAVVDEVVVGGASGGGIDEDRR